MRSLAVASLLAVLFASAAVAQTTVEWSPEMQLKLKTVASPRVSPDGKRVVYTVSDAAMTPDKSEFVSQIWLATIATKQNVQLTFGDKSSTNPKWSPDGNWIAFTSFRDGNNEIYIIHPDGKGLTRLTDSPISDWQARWGR